jgi:hypothetical protein
VNAEKVWVDGKTARALTPFGEKKWRRLVHGGVVPSWVDPGTVKVDDEGRPIPGTGTRYFSPEAVRAWAARNGDAA